jgi:hypothetical protein
MIDTKFVCTLAALVASVVVICNYDKKENFVENFAGSAGGMPQFEVRAEKVMACNQEAAARGEFFSVPNFQSQLSPRMFSESYGPDIRYNLPAHKNLAVPNHPLAAKEPFKFAKMARENYHPKQQCGDAKMSMPGVAPPLMNANYHNGNWNKVAYGPKTVEGFNGANPAAAMAAANSAMPSNAAANTKNGDVVASSGMLPAAAVKNNEPAAPNLPVSNMNMPMSAQQIAAAAKVDPNADPSCLCAGQEGEPIVYDRYIISNRNNRLRSQGDMIRGDLPIAKTNTGWFQTSAKPNEVLQQGAINVIAGVDNSTAQEMAAFLLQQTGNTASSSGGVPLDQQTVSQVTGEPANSVQVINRGLGI